MEQQENFAGISLESISVDQEGRVIVTDPQVAERLRSAQTARWRSNEGCNTAKGCGDGQNVRCTLTR